MKRLLAAAAAASMMVSPVIAQTGPSMEQMEQSGEGRAITWALAAAIAALVVYALIEVVGDNDGEVPTSP